jgi:hypothetical protein
MGKTNPTKAGYEISAQEKNNIWWKTSNGNGARTAYHSGPPGFTPDF